MDWTECELVERVEGRCGGRPTLIGSRIWPEIFLEGAEGGMTIEEMHEHFPTISVERIQGVLAFAQRKRSAA